MVGPDSSVLGDGSSAPHSQSGRVASSGVSEPCSIVDMPYVFMYLQQWLWRHFVVYSFLFNILKYQHILSLKETYQYLCYLFSPWGVSKQKIRKFDKCQIKYLLLMWLKNPGSITDSFGVTGITWLVSVFPPRLPAPLKKRKNSPSWSEKGFLSVKATHTHKQTRPQLL